MVSVRARISKDFKVIMPYAEEDLIDERTEFAFKRPIFNVLTFWEGTLDERWCPDGLDGLDVESVGRPNLGELDVSASSHLGAAGG